MTITNTKRNPQQRKTNDHDMMGKTVIVRIQNDSDTDAQHTATHAWVHYHG